MNLDFKTESLRSLAAPSFPWYYIGMIETGDQDIKEEMAKVTVSNDRKQSDVIDLDDLEQKALAEMEAKPMDPRYALAIRLYAIGSGSQTAICSRCQISLSGFNKVLRSDSGRALVVKVKGELDEIR